MNSSIQRLASILTFIFVTLICFSCTPEKDLLPEQPVIAANGSNTFRPGHGPCSEATVDFTNGYPTYVVVDNVEPEFSLNAETYDFEFDPADADCKGACGIEVTFSAGENVSLSDLALDVVEIHDVNGMANIDPQFLDWNPPVLLINSLQNTTNTHYKIKFENSNQFPTLHVFGIMPGVCVVDNLDILDPLSIFSIIHKPEDLYNYAPPTGN